MRPNVKHDARTRTSVERGLALLVVLWTILLLSLLASSTLDTSRSDVNLAFNLAENARAELLAEAAGNVALFGLLNTGSDETAWQSNGAIYAWRDEEAELRARVTEEGGRLDINEASPDLIASFMSAAGLDDEEARLIADAIVDFRDPDVDRRPRGAEDPEDEAAGQALGAKDAPFQMIEELVRIPGMTAELFDRVAPELTIFSGLELPDFDSAPPTVKAALENRRMDGPVEPASIPESGENQATGPTPALLVQGDQNLGTSRGLYRIEAAASLPSGAASGIELVVRVTNESVQPYEVLHRRHTAAGLFPDSR